MEKAITKVPHYLHQKNQIVPNDGYMYAAANTTDDPLVYSKPFSFYDSHHNDDMLASNIYRRKYVYAKWKARSRLLQRHIRIKPVHVEELLTEPRVAHAVHARHEGVDALEIHRHSRVVGHR
jgi:hypothetical protein